MPLHVGRRHPGRRSSTSGTDRIACSRCETRESRLRRLPDRGGSVPRAAVRVGRTSGLRDPGGARGLLLLARPAQG
jgi:hypothetical protein